MSVSEQIQWGWEYIQANYGEGLMAKKELLAEAQKAGLAPDTAIEDDYTQAQLQQLLNPESAPAWEGSASSNAPLIGPDGHVHLSQEDIDARQ